MVFLANNDGEAKPDVFCKSELKPNEFTNGAGGNDDERFNSACGKWPKMDHMAVLSAGVDDKDDDLGLLLAVTMRLSMKGFSKVEGDADSPYSLSKCVVSE